MDSVTFIQGSTKVTHHLDNQPPPKKPTTTTTVIATLTISALLLLTLTLCAIFHKSKTTVSPNSHSPSLAIKKICNFTLYPDTCFSSISSLNTSPNPHPKSIFNLSLRLSITQLSNLSSFLKTLHSQPVLGDCQDQFDDALSRFNDSVKIVEFTETKISDIQTWISAALTDQQTCLDGLEAMDSPPLLQLNTKIQESMEFTSNSLAIIANFHIILRNFNMTLH